MNPIPSPTPPWARPVVSPNTETLAGTGTIGLVYDTTYLNQTAPADLTDETVGYALVLPDGNYLRQIKRIYVPKGNENTTAVFTVAGTFVGFSTLIFNKLARAAVLEWDGAGWHLIGGNATTELDPALP